MSNSSDSSVQLLNVQIDGVWHQFPKGTRVIEACERAGNYVPRYCYHKKLSAPGNCRMCLVEMGMAKLGPDRKPELGPDGIYRRLQRPPGEPPFDMQSYLISTPGRIPGREGIFTTWRVADRSRPAWIDE